MKKLFIYTAIALASTFVSCKKDGPTGPAPTNLDPSSFSHEAREGAVVLKWATPDNANYKYIEVKYFHPGTQKEHLRLASIHSNQIEIDELLKAYGVIEYKLTPVTAGGVRGTTQVIAAECLAVPPRTVDEPTKLTLNPQELWTNAQEPTEGPIANLVDGGTSTFFHTRWSQPQLDLPHYIVVKLPTDVSYKVLSITYTNRAGGNHSAPKDVEVFATKDFDKVTFNPDQFNKVKIGEATGLQAGAGVVNRLPNYTLNDTYNYLWFKVNTTTGNTKFFSMAEFEVFRHKITTVNPETGERTEI